VFEFGIAEQEDFGFRFRQIGDGVLVCRFLRFFSQSDWRYLLMRGLCFPVFWARMVFWKPMLSAERSMAVGAFEW
jgi:hypothetical protein